MESPRKMPCMPQPARPVPVPVPVQCSPRPQFRFDKLTAEVIAIIFRELRHIDLASALRSRLVCRRFDELGTPICYADLTVTPSVVDYAERYARLRRHISIYTSHITVRSAIDAARVRALLASIQALSSITLQYIRGSTAPFSLLKDAMRPDTKLTIQNLPLGSSHCSSDIPLPSSLAHHLVSLHLVSPAPPLTTKTDSLKALLVQCGSLHTLAYEDVGRGTNFTFASGERMPAVSTLTLRSYDWDHSPETVRRHWDFSRLRHLALSSVPVYNFLRSLGQTDLVGLTSLRVHEGAYVATERREEASHGLYLLVKSRIRALDALDIQCDARVFGHDAILRHGDTLRELRFRHHAQDTHLTLDQLRQLSEGLPCLQLLELDVEASCNADVVQALSSFPRLRRLVLHACALLEPQDKVDRDYEAARHMFACLVHARETLYPESPWRSVTLNVGGRQPAGKRKRIAAALCTERCFVLRDGLVYEDAAS